MDKLSKENNNLPAKTSGVGTQVTLGVVGNFIYDNYVKGGLPLVISYLTGQLAYVSGFGWFVIVLSAVVVFTLIAISLHLFELRRTKQGADNANELSILPPTEPNDAEQALIIATEENNVLKREIESLKELAGNIKESREILRDELEDDKKKLRAELTGLDRLIVLEKEHFEKIDFKFRMVRAFYCFEELDKSIPSMNFGFDVCNDSIFEIVVEKVEGYIEFEGDKLTGEMFCITNPSKIAPLARHETFTIKQRISQTEKPALLAARPLRGANFQISNLEITFRGGENADQMDVPEDGGELGWGKRNIHKFEGIKFLSNGDETGISAIGGVAEIGFSQRVDQSELEYLEQWKLNRPDLKNNYENYFIVNKLKFTIRGADPKWKVEEKVFTIPNEKIPIHKDRYIEMYDKAGIERL